MSKQQNDLTSIVRKIVTELLADKDFITRKEARAVARAVIDEWAGISAPTSASATTIGVASTGGSSADTAVTTTAPATVQTKRTRSATPMTVEEKRAKDNAYQARYRAKVRAEKAAAAGSTASDAAEGATPTAPAAKTKAAEPKENGSASSHEFVPTVSLDV